MRCWHRVLRAARILSLILALAPFHPPSRAASFRVGLRSWVGFGPVYLARDLGMFQDDVVDEDLIVLTGLAQGTARFDRDSSMRWPHRSTISCSPPATASRLSWPWPSTSLWAGTAWLRSAPSPADLQGRRVAA